MRILLVEDYAPLRLAVSQALTLQGYAVDAAGDGTEGRWFATGNSYDLIILDIMLPGIDGLSLLGEFRRNGNSAHVLIITARDSVDDRIAGLDLGADDYLVKPFVMNELLARVRALLRRGYESKNPLITIADLEVDTVRHLVRRAGRAIELTSREYSLLEYLALRRDTLVTRDDIREHLYDFSSDHASNVINVYIGYLRRKIGDRPMPLLHTRRGQGYVLSEERDV
jgi:DNA-binding response OmpR family regulator